MHRNIDHPMELSALRSRLSFNRHPVPDDLHKSSKRIGIDIFGQVTCSLSTLKSTVEPMPLGSARFKQHSPDTVGLCRAG